MFRLVKILNGRTNQGEPVRLPSTPSISYSYGMALTLRSGRLGICGATTAPSFICCEDYAAPATDNREILVEPVSPDMIFEVPFAASPAGINVGAKVTIAAGGMSVTATTTDGVATIFDKAGAEASGDKCLVQFK